MGGVYSEKQNVEVTGADGGPVQFETLTPEERKARITEYMQKLQQEK